MGELTAGAKFRNQGTLWSVNFLSADETTPVTTIVVAKGGTELTAAFKKKCSWPASNNSVFLTGA
jgi:hypothetical protein